MNTLDMLGDYLNKRELDEIEFATIYAKEFAHGTDGHNRLILVSKLADLLDVISDFCTKTLTEEQAQELFNELQGLNQESG